MTQTDEVMVALGIGGHRARDLPFSDALDMTVERARDLPFSDALDMTVERARGTRLHALLNGDFGGAVVAEQAWQPQRAAWVELLERCGWPPEAAGAEVRSRERACDAVVRDLMQREPGLSLDGLLGRLGRD